MRLFLSSYRAGNHSATLKSFYKPRSEVLVISNAKDYKNSEERLKSLSEIMNFLQGLNYKPVELDLRNYFSKRIDWEAFFKQQNQVWIAGGNTFVLRRALDEAAVFNTLKALVLSGSLIYGGESAGACITSPTLDGIEYGDDSSVIPEGYKNTSLMNSGLTLIDFSVVPHYKSDWAGSEEMIKVLKHNGIKYETITDSEVLVVEDQEVKKLK